MVSWQTVRLLSRETAASPMTARLKRALEDSVADPDRLHQRLFYALCYDLTGLAKFENAVESTVILDLVGDYAASAWEAEEHDTSLK
jgi:hypothetical protein